MGFNSGLKGLTSCLLVGMKSGTHQNVKFLTDEDQYVFAKDKRICFYANQ
jgi:hypothetical protein